ncbi:MAG: hypothetical protein H7Y43_13745 [Akkermansiaceae bacterium]|nr:hypothetical protein [Verrucomicrobiales bacterium]
MKLVFHHFKKDVRQFRIFLAIWLGLLLLDLAVNLSWVGNPELSPSGRFDSASNSWTGLLPVVLWALTAILPSLVVLADSPARHEGFLSTRPMPRRDLFLAKILYIVALLVVPWALAEMAHLTLQGLPAWAILRGTFERLLISLPVAVGFAAFAALWPGTARWVRALGTLVGVYVLTGMTFSLLMNVLHLPDLPSPTTSGIFVWAYLFVLTLVLLAAWHSRSHRGWKFRWGGLVVCLALSWFGGTMWKGEFFRLQPENPQAAQAVFSQSGFEISTRNILLSSEQSPDENAPVRFQVLLTPKTKLLPAAHVIEWSGKDARLLRPTGGVIPRDGKFYPRHLFFGNPWNATHTMEELTAWASEFPEGVLFRQFNFNNGSSSFPNARLDLPRFKVPENAGERAESLNLEADFDAQVFQWRKIADLPLTPGVVSKDAFGSWKIISGQTIIPQPNAHLFVERHQIELLTATDSRCSSFNYGPLSRMVLAVYDPETRIVWLPDHSYNTVKRGSHTGLTRHFINFYLNERQPFTAAELSRCRLVVLEKTWVGSVPKKWQSPAFTLDEKLSPAYANGFNNTASLPREEFSRRIAALQAPAPNAPRREVSLYLLKFLQLVDAHRISLDPRDPEIAKLGEYVPEHLDLLLDGLPAMNRPSKRAVLAALRVSATEQQKSAILAALRSEPELAEILLARGWLNDARAEVYQLATSSRSLPFAALQAIASFRDPQTYPRLLEAFETEPSEKLDDLLHLLGLSEQAAPIVERAWRKESLVLRQDGAHINWSAFTLAMSHGQTNALQFAYRLLNDPEVNQTHWAESLHDVLRKTIWMPDLNMEAGHSSDSVFAWMRQHRPEDFVFHPVRRQFVLRTNLVPALSGTAKAQTP